MSQKRIGFLVVNKKTGFMLETKDHAAKIFDTLPETKVVCSSVGANVPVPVNYENAALSLLKGAAFAFTTEDGHRKFLGHVRNDPSNKPFMAFSQNREFVQWRYQALPPASPANVVSDAAAQVSAKSASNQPGAGEVAFNPDVLLR